MRTFEEINADVQRVAAINDVDGLRTLASELLALGTPIAEAAAWNALGAVAGITADYPLALELCGRARDRFEELGDREGVADATRKLGIVHAFTGDVVAALEHHGRALALHEELGDRSGIALDLLNIGNAQVDTGNYHLALEHYGRALTIEEEIGNRAGMALVMGNTGNVYHNTGDHATAMEYYRRALAVHEELGDRYGVARVIGNIGNLYSDFGDYVLALDYGARALSLHEELGARSSAALVTGNLGAVYLKTGDYTAALEQYRHALAVYQDIGHVGGEAHVTGLIIDVLLKLERYDDAAMLLEQQARMHMEHPSVRAQHFVNRAGLAEHTGDLNSAHTLLREALETCIASGMRSIAAECHLMLRDLAQKRNDFTGYIEHNNEFLRITEEIRGKEATQKLSMMEAERKMEGERREREKERALLYGALPTEIANRMVRGEDVSGDHFNNAAVMFIDIVGFTSNTSHMPPNDVVKMLEHIFGTIDSICAKHDVIKVKTIGDSYMCFASEGNGEWGIGNSSEQRAASPEQRVADVALAIQQAEFYWPREAPHEDSLDRLTFRIGIHSGPVTAGVIGTQRLQYDVWGDTVNVASRMESHGEPGRIHVSEAFALALSQGRLSQGQPGQGQPSHGDETVIPSVSVEPGTWHLALRGETELKGKGTMTTYWLELAQ